VAKSNTLTHHCETYRFLFAIFLCMQDKLLVTKLKEVVTFIQLQSIIDYSSILTGYSVYALE